MILTVLLALAAAAPVQSSSCVADGLHALRGAATRADSLALAERWTAATGGDATCRALLAGYVAALTSTGAEAEWERRVRATAQLERALRAYPDEPRVFLGMGILLYHRQARTDARRMFDRALDRADRGVPLTPRERALGHYVRGQIHSDFWRDWRSYGEIGITSDGQWHCGRYENPVTSGFGGSDLSWLADLNLLCPERFERNMRTYFLPRSTMRQDELRDAAQEYRAAFAADTTFAAPLEALLAEYVYLGRWADADSVVARLRAALPAAARPLLYEGLVRQAQGETRAAGIAFGRAFGRLPAEAVRAYTDIAPVLPPDQAARYAASDSVAQVRFASAYWNALDPLYLTAANERRLEHYARVVAADLLFASRAQRERGRETFAGRIWIRYGRPRTMREVSLSAGRLAFWDFGPGPDIALTRGTAYRGYRPTHAAAEYADRLRRTSPATYAPGLADSVASLGRQVVRSAGTDGTPTLLLLAAWPDAFAEAEGGLVLLDPNFQPAAQWRGRRPPAGGLRSELRRVPPGAYSLAIELWDRGRRRLARVRDTVTVVRPDSAFGVSDLLLARAAQPAPRAGGFADLALTPLYAPVVRRDEPLVVAWEVWAFDGRERLAYEVELELQDAGRRPVLARILGGIGLAGDRAPAARIAFRSEGALIQGKGAAWVALGTDLDRGTYRLVMTFRSGDHTVVREREIVLR